VKVKAKNEVNAKSKVKGNTKVKAKSKVKAKIKVKAKTQVKPKIEVKAEHKVKECTLPHSHNKTKNPTRQTSLTNPSPTKTSHTSTLTQHQRKGVTKAITRAAVKKRQLNIAALIYTPPTPKVPI
jgi:hypothetical protein